MELNLRARISLAFAVGAWSLAAQFVFNRIIFFYVANSEYVAAAIISIHLAGFWLGTLAARKWKPKAASLVAASLAVAIVANAMVWRMGGEGIGHLPTVIGAVVCGLALAALSGALVVRLMGKPADDGRGVLIADSAGSVLGAVLGGFVLVPQWGIDAAFAVVMAAQALTLMGVMVLQRETLPRRVMVVMALPVVVAFALIVQAPPRTFANLLVVETSPPADGEVATASLITSEPTPYGVVSVMDVEDKRELRIDNQILCHAQAEGLESLSEWVVGARPLEMLKWSTNPNLRVANIGLGCGVTLAALLDGLKPNSMVDVVEINPGVPAAQRHFRPYLRHHTDDARVTMNIADGFRFFAERQGQPPYDVVVIDTAWMRNMNATHLFSLEMYQNIRANLADDGVLAVWSEEGSPFSDTSQIIHRTLSAVFPYVRVEIAAGTVLFYASATRADMGNLLSPDANTISHWLAEAARDAPVNRLDNLVMNQAKFGRAAIHMPSGIVH